MEKEIISFERSELFIKITNLIMEKGGTYRGMHSHSAIEIIKVKNGSLTCYIGDKAVCAMPNDIILINGNIAHRLCSDNAEITYINIDISHYEKNDFYDEFINLYNFISSLNAKAYTVFSDNKQLIDIFEKIIGKYYENNQNSRWYLRAYIYELIAFMHEHCFIISSSLFSEQIKKIEPIIRFIDANFKTPVILDDVCSVVKYNKYTVCHCFKEITGATVFDYVNFLRVSHAITNLKNNNLSILEIANDCGFSSVTYFNRVFKNTIGCSPSEYKKHIVSNI